MTLCPILDFANHAPERTSIIPVLSSSAHPPAPRRSKSKSKLFGGDYVFNSSNERTIAKGEELFLKYGSHSNHKLFCEYGFVNGWREGDCLRGDFFGDVSVENYIVNSLFSKISKAINSWLEETLKEEGYWGYYYSFSVYIHRYNTNIFLFFLRYFCFSDWTIHSSPKPAHPSYRLMTALRLYHLVDESSREVVNNDQSRASWQAVLTGQRDVISAANEQAWRGSLLSICRNLVTEAEEGVHRMQDHSAGLISDGPTWFTWMFDNIKLLWREQLEVAQAVADSIVSGEEF